MASILWAGIRGYGVCSYQFRGLLSLLLSWNTKHGPDRYMHKLFTRPGPLATYRNSEIFRINEISRISYLVRMHASQYCQHFETTRPMSSDASSSHETLSIFYDCDILLEFTVKLCRDETPLISTLNHWVLTSLIQKLLGAYICVV